MTQMLDDLRIQLNSPNPEQRRRATSDLTQLDADLASDLVIQALSDDDWRVRKEGVRVALAFAPNAGLLERLIAVFSSSDHVGLRNAAVEAIGGYGEEAVDALAAALPDLDEDGRKLAVEALGGSGRSSALAVLATLLEDSDPNVRVAAVEAITGIGTADVGEVTSLLEGCLFSGEPLTLLAALSGINTLGGTLPWSTVERLLAQPALQHAALLAAGRTGDARAVPVLLKSLLSARGSGLLEVTLALRELLREPEALAELRAKASGIAPEVGKKLAALVSDEREADENRRAALVVLGALGLPQAAQCALVALGEDRLLADAHEALELLGERAIPALVEGAHFSDPPSRASCLGLLARIVEPVHAVQAVAVARAALSDESPDVQREGLGLLARVGDASSLADVVRLVAPDLPSATLKAAEMALVDLARRHPEAARELASKAEPGGTDAHAGCMIIGALGGGASGDTNSDIAFLTDATSNASAVVRRVAIEALADIGGSRGVEAIAFALTDEERDVRQVAIAALGRIRAEDGSASGVAHLVDLVEHASEPELLAAAVRALGETGDSHALSVLKPLARAAQPIVAVSAVEALARLAGGRRFDALIEGLSHPDGEVVKATMLALSEAADARVIAHLGACLDHDAWDVRRLAADLLGRISGESALGLLRARQASEESPPVQEALARALERAAGIRRSPAPSLSGSLRPR